MILKSRLVYLIKIQNFSKLFYYQGLKVSDKV